MIFAISLTVTTPTVGTVIGMGVVTITKYINTMKHTTPTPKNPVGRSTTKGELSVVNKRRKAEANARRKVAKNWDSLSRGLRYQKAAAREACTVITLNLIGELFDGTLLDLNERNRNKSHNAQQRILRRIVEKRQAQSTHRRVRRSSGALARHLRRSCVNMSMRQLSSYQHCK